jgi:hypothetical protein
MSRRSAELSGNARQEMGDVGYGGVAARDRRPDPVLDCASSNKAQLLFAGLGFKPFAGVASQPEARRNTPTAAALGLRQMGR